MIIISTQNEKIKYFESLKFNKNQRLEEKYLIESDHLVREAIKQNKLSTLIVCEDVEENYNFKGETVVVSYNVCKKLSDLQNPSRVFGVCKFESYQTITGTRLLLLDNIQDPSNIGALIRSAKAFDFQTIIASSNSCSFYNSKVLRAAQGNHFQVNLLNANLEIFLEENKDEYQIITTFLDEKSDLQQLKSNEKIILILGNEGSGVTTSFKKYATINYKIAIANNVDSLNVAIAGSIIMEKLFNHNLT